MSVRIGKEAALSKPQEINQSNKDSMEYFQVTLKVILPIATVVPGYNNYW